VLKGFIMLLYAVAAHGVALWSAATASSFMVCGCVVLSPVLCQLNNEIVTSVV
jgi:hypothetical protein